MLLTSGRAEIGGITPAPETGAYSTYDPAELQAFTALLRPGMQELLPSSRVRGNTC